MSKPTYRVSWTDVMTSVRELGVEHDVIISLVASKPVTRPEETVWHIRLGDAGSYAGAPPLHAGQCVYKDKQEHSWPAFLMRDVWQVVQEYNENPWLWSERKRKRTTKA